MILCLLQGMEQHTCITAQGGSGDLYICIPPFLSLPPPPQPSDKFKGHGNSFHGVGGRGSKLAQLRLCLRLLLSVCSTGDEGVHLDLHEQGAIPVLVGEPTRTLQPHSHTLSMRLVAV